MCITMFVSRYLERGEVISRRSTFTMVTSLVDLHNTHPMRLMRNVRGKVQSIIKNAPRAPLLLSKEPNTSTPSRNPVLQVIFNIL